MTRHRLLLQQVRTLGRYSDDEEAGRVLDTVLTLLGSQLTGEERCDLAAVLPEQDRAVLVSQVPLPEPVTAPAFVEAVARALHTSLACARWDTSRSSATATPSSPAPTWVAPSVSCSPGTSTRCP